MAAERLGRSLALIFASLLASFLALFRLLYQPTPRDLELRAHARVERDRAGDNRRNLPFLAFIDRARAHAQASSGGYVLGSKGWAY